TYAVHTPGDKRCEDVIKWTGFDGQNNAENNARYIAAFNPEVVQAVLDEREAQSKRIAELEVNLAALAAENAALKRFIKGSCYVFHGEQADISDGYSPADESPLMPDTPAIDAILEKSRAQGVQIAINELVALSPRLDKRAAETLSMAVERLRKQLKKGASSEQN
ncbi:ead/Ea22-like family protein, partial [Escherichia coli]|uniref:ead/Ea22-like family protein n=1 Tax=Escherichia coli TaxID=562 RepID=UPI002023B0A4